MSVRNLDAIFWPRRIAVIGASDREGSVGRAVTRNLVHSKFDGEVFPVNPNRDTVQGVKAYPDMTGLPSTPDLAIICTPDKTVPGIVRQCGETGVRGLIILTAGFGESGGEGRKYAILVEEELRKFRGLRALGPNCLGAIVPGIGMNASFAADMPDSGHLAFISQSGALCTSILDLAIQNRIGFSHFVSVGNMLDVDFGDLIDYLSAEPQVKALIMYIESVLDSRKFISAARAFSRTKPIIAYKAGRFAESAQAAASHTGALAGADDVYDAAFRRAGIERVYELEDLFEVAELLARRRPVHGRRLAIVTNAGGPGVVATDALIARGGTLASLSDDTMKDLNEFLPPHWSHGNPVDVLGDAPPERLAKALEIILRDQDVDAALVTLAPQAMTDPTETAQVISKVARSSRKTILAAWMGGYRMEGGIRILSEAGIPVYRNCEDCVKAFMHLVNYNRNLDLLYETPREIPVEMTSGDEEQARSLLLDSTSGFGDEERVTLTEDVSKKLLEIYQIPVTRTIVATTADEAVEAAKAMGYPVVLKILSPDITHKTDVDGISLNLQTEVTVRQAFERITKAAHEHCPDADIRGVTVQPMVRVANSIELILGMKYDRTFGAAIMIGSGGTGAEVFKDRSIQLPPLNERRALHMLQSLKTWPILDGYRGRPGANVDAVIETLIRFSYLVSENPSIQEIDINPLLASEDGVVGLDARIVVDRKTLLHPPRAYQHLAIRPYPEEFTKEVKLSEGTPATLRPIKPEDEPMWHSLLGRCSPESLWFRLGSAIKSTTHKMATRYCYVDYDREIAIVVEIEDEGERKIIAVGRLVAGPNRESAEYAILVDDAWQGMGVGSMLTDYCLDVAVTWGMKQVNAITLPQNDRMLRIFRRRRFASQYSPGAEWVSLTLDLTDVMSTTAHARV